MPRQIVLTPEAATDVTDSYDWYEKQNSGLGEDFLTCLEAAFTEIAKYPTRYPIRFDAFRRILIRRFPYAIYFDYDDKSVIIYYVFHCSQNLTKLTKRLRNS